MKERREFILNTLNVIHVIILFYIVGSKSLFLYVLSLSLYKIFISSFNHISIKDTLKKNNYSKIKIFRMLSSVIIIISLVFLLLSIMMSDIISLLLKIDDIMPIFIMMGITIFIKPFIKLLSEYLENKTQNINYLKLEKVYDFIDKLLLLFIALFVFRIFRFNNITSISLLYISKILSFIIIIIYLYFTKIINFKNVNVNKDNLNYKREIKNILSNNSYKSITTIVKYSYYYLSIVILYLVLTTRYNYKINDLENIITFIYFYSLTLINYIIFIVKEMTKERTGIDKIYNSFKVILTFAIIFGIISPLICKVLFNDSNKSIYLTMVNFLSIFILLYNLTYDEVKDKRVVYISLIMGLIFKIVLVIPLINSFYRMGYNLLYGDIVSTIIGMLISVIINYIYLRNKSKNGEKYFEKILDILYENIILAIILILVEFIIPIDPSSYFKSIGLIFIYLLISITYIKLKNKKRG